MRYIQGDWALVAKTRFFMRRIRQPIYFRSGIDRKVLGFGLIFPAEHNESVVFLIVKNRSMNLNDLF